MKKFGGGNVMVLGCITADGVEKHIKVSNKWTFVDIMNLLAVFQA